MGEIKTYMVVTNDEYEHIVKADLKGARSVGEFLGITENSVRQHICRNRWGKKYKYKAVIDTSVVNDPSANRKAYAKRYRMDMIPGNTTGSIIRERSRKDWQVWNSDRRRNYESA
mgnify:CR=1 FL=1